MSDILLDADGDIAVSALGDISLTNSVRQAVRIRLRWILGEWRLGPVLGFPWFEQVFVKNPNSDQLRRLIRDEIMKIDAVTDAEVQSVRYDPVQRTAAFVCICSVGEATFREEVILRV